MAELAEDAIVREGDDATTSNGDPSAAGGAESLAAAAGSMQDIVADTADDIARTVSALIREKPLLAVGLAATIAYVLGRLRS